MTLVEHKAPEKKEEEPAKFGSLRSKFESKGKYNFFFIENLSQNFTTLETFFFVTNSHWKFFIENLFQFFLPPETFFF